MSRDYGVLADEFTVYLVNRRPGLPSGYSMKEMADDYAVMIREEFGAPVDVIGISTGGSIAQHFAADHPDLVRRLVLHSNAHTLSDAAKRGQMEVGNLARQGRWREAWAVLLAFMHPHTWPGRFLVWFSSSILSLAAPKHPSDLVVTIEAEDAHEFRGRLGEITAPTLVVAGARDLFYSVALFHETAAGIPNARLILYQRMGHPAAGKQFRRDLLNFLTGDTRRESEAWDSGERNLWQPRPRGS
jgi:pimeloyl-ACP methyl ester carboxylesterase